MHNFFIPLFKKKSDYKIFCIGFFKTGTNSLSEALSILGYRTGHFLRAGKMPKQGWIEYIKKLNYDAYTDSPMPRKDLYKKLDEAFPNSKFILTIRDNKSLEKSILNYFKGTSGEIKDSEQLERAIKRYDEHNREIIDYFQKKPSQLLIMNLFEGDGWDKLCGFLDKPIPKRPFPHKNKGRYKRSDVSDL